MMLPDNFLLLRPYICNMKQYLRFFLLSAVAICLVIQVSAQDTKNKKARTKKAEQVEQPPEPPPPPQEFHKDKIEMVAIDTTIEKEEDGPGAIPGMPVPQVDFDTSVVVMDAFSKDILKLLDVTNAINLGGLMAENMPKDYENNEMMKELYTRLIKDMKEGAARRWLERAYIREYKKKFTQAEIIELVKFYESPIGKKLVKNTFDMLPGLMNQGKNIGAYRGVELYMEMMGEKP